MRDNLENINELKKIVFFLKEQIMTGHLISLILFRGLKQTHDNIPFSEYTTVFPVMTQTGSAFRRVLTVSLLIN